MAGDHIKTILSREFDDFVKNEILNLKKIDFTGNLANFCGFCWFLTERKILFGLLAHRHSKLIYVLPHWIQIWLFSGPINQKTGKKGKNEGFGKNKI